MVLMPKNDGSLRFLFNYRRLNAFTVPYMYPLLRMDNFLDSLGDSEVFTALDANCVYGQIPLISEDQYKTSFTTNMVTYMYKRMTFELINAPFTFQMSFFIILIVVRWKRCLVYFYILHISGRARCSCLLCPLSAPCTWYLTEAEQVIFLQVPDRLPLTLCPA